jgi:hypothetical protein
MKNSRTGWYLQVWAGENCIENSNLHQMGNGSYLNALHLFNIYTTTGKLGDRIIWAVDLYKGEEEAALMEGYDELPGFSLEDPKNYYWHIKHGCDWDVVKSWVRPV